MEVYLIRHTTPVLTEGLIYGHLDVLLADSFTAEKKLVINQLPKDLDMVYSSPSLRCTQLATVISQLYQKDAALRELNFGDWEGKTWGTIDRQECDIWMNDFVNLSPPNGESMQQMEYRIMQFWNDLLQQPYQKVAIITHGGVIRILLAKYRGISLKDSFSIQIAMAEVIKVSVSSSSPLFHLPNK